MPSLPEFAKRKARQTLRLPKQLGFACWRRKHSESANMAAATQLKNKLRNYPLWMKFNFFCTNMPCA